MKKSLFALTWLAALWGVVGCGSGGAEPAPPAARSAAPAGERLAVGELVLGTWLPAGLDRFRFSAEDQALLAAAGFNSVEWLQRAEADGLSAEQHLMGFCAGGGLAMPVYYEPPGFSPYDKLRNWARRAPPGPGFADSVAVLVQALQDHWSGSRGFSGYLVGHEDYKREYYPALRGVVDAIGARDRRRPAINVGRIDHYDDPAAFADAFFRAAGPPNIFQHEHYVFRSDVPNEGPGLQSKLDFLLSGYDEVARLLRSRRGRWHAIVQVQSEVRGGKPYYRKPSAAEIEVQAGLALTRGAAGIVYFVYSSGIERVRTKRGTQVRVYEGLVDRDGKPTASYAAVQAINARLRALSPVLADLFYYGATGMPGELVARSAPELEFGYFGAAAGASHVLVVNRRTQARRGVALTLRGVGVRDAITGQVLAAGDGAVELDLGAGGWRLLAVGGDGE